MNLDLFKTLLVVARLKSITKASEEIYITPTAVTKQIKALESEYRIKIFEEKSKKRILTEDGKILLKYANQIVNLVLESKQSLPGGGRLVQGTLRLASNFALGVYVLPKLFRLYSARYPDLDIKISLQNTEQLIKSIECHEVNFGFIGRRLDNSSIGSHLFYKDRICLVVGPDLGIRKKVVSWRELQSMPFIQRERGSDIRDACDKWLRDRKLKLNVKMELNNTEAIKTCLKCGIGFSMLPQSTIYDEVKSGQLDIISAPHFNLTQEHYICHYRHKAFSPVERVFLEFLFVAIEEHLLRDSPRVLS